VGLGASTSGQSKVAAKCKPLVLLRATRALAEFSGSATDCRPRRPANPRTIPASYGRDAENEERQLADRECRSRHWRKDVRRLDWRHRVATARNGGITSSQRLTNSDTPPDVSSLKVVTCMSRVSSSACSSGKSRAGRETRRNAFRNRRVARHMTSVGARSRLRSQPRRANGLAAASRLASFSDGGGDRLRAGGARAASRASRTQSAVSYFESSWSRPPRPSSARRDRRRRRCTEVIGEVCRSLASGEGVVKTRRML